MEGEGTNIVNMWDWLHLAAATAAAAMCGMVLAKKITRSCNLFNALLG